MTPLMEHYYRVRKVLNGMNNGVVQLLVFLRKLMFKVLLLKIELAF